MQRGRIGEKGRQKVMVREMSHVQGQGKQDGPFGVHPRRAAGGCEDRHEIG